MLHRPKLTLPILMLAAALAGQAIAHAGTRSEAEKWIPIRWWDPSPASLELLKNTPVNCLRVAGNRS